MLVEDCLKTTSIVNPARNQDIIHVMLASMKVPENHYLACIFRKEKRHIKLTAIFATGVCEFKKRRMEEEARALKQFHERTINYD